MFIQPNKQFMNNLMETLSRVCDGKISSEDIIFDTTEKDFYVNKFMIICGEYSQGTSVAKTTVDDPLSFIKGYAIVTEKDLNSRHFTTKITFLKDKIIFVDVICSNQNKAKYILNYLENETYFDGVALTATPSAYSYYIQRGYLRTCDLNRTIFPFFKYESTSYAKLPNDMNERIELIALIRSKGTSCRDKLFRCQEHFGTYCPSDSFSPFRTTFVLMKKIEKITAGGTKKERIVTNKKYGCKSTNCHDKVSSQVIKGPTRDIKPSKLLSKIIQDKVSYRPIRRSNSDIKPSKQVGKIKPDIVSYTPIRRPPRDIKPSKQVGKIIQDKVSYRQIERPTRESSKQVGKIIQDKVSY
jgi:hypothetical protein